MNYITPNASLYIIVRWSITISSGAIRSQPSRMLTVSLSPPSPRPPWRDRPGAGEQGGREEGRGRCRHMDRATDAWHPLSFYHSDVVHGMFVRHRQMEEIFLVRRYGFYPSTLPPSLPLHDQHSEGRMGGFLMAGCLRQHQGNALGGGKVGEGVTYRQI